MSALSDIMTRKKNRWKTTGARRRNTEVGGRTTEDRQGTTEDRRRTTDDGGKKTQIGDGSLAQNCPSTIFRSYGTGKSAKKRRLDVGIKELEIKKRGRSFNNLRFRSRFDPKARFGGRDKWNHAVFSG
jgi:hypothetical protein